MKGKFWTVSVSLLLLCSSCATSPRMPKYRTKQEKACAMECPQGHALCMQGIRGVPSRADCDDLLDQCYKTCQKP